jgi:hypothetical protein
MERQVATVRLKDRVQVEIDKYAASFGQPVAGSSRGLAHCHKILPTSRDSIEK